LEGGTLNEEHKKKRRRHLLKKMLKSGGWTWALKSRGSLGGKAGGRWLGYEASKKYT